MLLKAKGQSAQVAKPELLAFASIARVAQMEERLSAKLEAAGSIPATGTIFSPARSANCLRGLTSGFRQRQGFYAHCHFGPYAGKRQGPNDVPQLPY
jgi:hypothetical protein